MLTTIFISVLVIALLIAAMYFILPSLTPIPFFPTHKRDVPYVASLLLEHSPTHVVDIGAGSGRVIFATRNMARAKNLKTQCIALEVNPLLVFLLHVRRLFFTRMHKMHVIWGNIFTLNTNVLFRHGSPESEQQPPAHRYAVYIYGTPSQMGALAHKLEELPAGTRVISYMLTLPSWEKRLVTSYRRHNNIFVYQK